MTRTMKIKVDDSNRQSIISALEKLGHRRAENGLDFYETADYFYTYEGMSQFTHGGTEDTFNNHKNTEYFLVNGEFVTKGYWTAPKTTFTAGMNLYDPKNKTTYEPLPKEQNVPTITPRAEFLRQRVSEILAAMARFNDLKMVPPSEWHLELEDIFEEIKNA